MPEPPEEIVELAERRARARAAKEFGEADAIRSRIASAGWTVEDAPGGGYTLAQAERPEDVRVRAADVPSVLDETATADASVQWVCEGWPEDIDRAIGSFRANAGERKTYWTAGTSTKLRVRPSLCELSS